MTHALKQAFCGNLKENGNSTKLQVFFPVMEVKSSEL